MKMMLKKLGAGCVLLSLLNASAFAEVKIATINLAKTFDGYWKTKQVQSSLKERQAQLEKDLREKVENFEKGKQEYQKLYNAANDSAVSSEESAKRQREVADKKRDLGKSEADIKQYQAQASTTLQEEERLKTKYLFDEIKLAIAGKAKEGGYALVLDAGTLLYASGDNDITDTVLAQLNANAPAELARPEIKQDSLKEPKK